MVRELIEQVVGPEFKLQYCQGKERKKEEERKKELKNFNYLQQLLLSLHLSI
jgi:hypothetical protein